MNSAMKKIFFFILGLFFHPLVFAQDFTVKNLTVKIVVHADGTFDVEESYQVEFSTQKHGIYRYIPIKYQFSEEEGETYTRKIKISQVKVPGYRFKTNHAFEQDLKGNFEIKIGDKNRYVFGFQNYDIQYRVDQALISTDQQVQFYWNIKSGDWEAEFEHISFEIQLPNGAVVSPENAFVYSGKTSTEAVSKEFVSNYNGTVFSSKSTSSLRSSYGDHVTVLIKMPAAIFTKSDFSPSLFAQYYWLSFLLLPLLVFYRFWLKYGKDTKVVSFTSYYPPKGIDAAIAGYLINDQSDTNDLLALLPKWGAEGIIVLEEIPKKGIFGKSDMRITALKTLPSTAADYEKTIYNGLFEEEKNEVVAQLSRWMKSALGVKKQEAVEGFKVKSVLVSDLTNRFHVHMSEAKRELKQEAQRFYEPKSKQIQLYSYILSVVLGLVIVPFLFVLVGLVAGILGVLTFLFLFVMSYFMQKKNKKGDAIYSELKGFRQFIRLAEIERIKVLIEEDPTYFEQTMSYALAFDLLNVWATKFEALQISPPSWYHMHAVSRGMGMSQFTQSFSSSMSNAKSAMVSTPSSKGGVGGGSSGGGFGGGGGGSW